MLEEIKIKHTCKVHLCLKSGMIVIISVTIKILMIKTTTIMVMIIISSSGRCEGKFDQLWKVHRGLEGVKWLKDDIYIR